MRESAELFKRMKDMQGKGEQGGIKMGVDRKGYKGGQSHVKWGRSAHLSG